MQIPQSNVRNMLASISSLNHVLTETIDMVKLVNSDCPDCEYDPIRKESANPYCQTCDGKGTIQTEQKYSIPSSIETNEDLKYEFKEVGRVVVGQINATIDKKEIATLDPSSQFNMNDQNSIKDFLDQYDHINWQGSSYVIQEFQGAYLQGNFYEIDLVLNLKDLSGS